MTIIRDASSLANSHEVKVTHLNWNVTVNFDGRTLTGTATLTLERVLDTATVVDLDTSHLIIFNVKDKDSNDLSYILYDAVLNKPHLGRKLSVTLPINDDRDDTKIIIFYATTPFSTAIQWLPPAQTAGQQYPYLFTQCQAIHARSLVPCQDAPGVKMTYAATVTAPDWARHVLSAVLQYEESVPGRRTSHWQQTVPISSYLLCLAVGDLQKRDLSPRCAIWSEPALLEAAAYEFAQTEDFLQTAEKLAGTEYVWGRYDLLCLPPSFPYGGMENPCLTFVTPTLLAGDRSLADVVAHEIAHSWTGNLVTNATWDHFWLNEGWTTWFQRKIMARIHGDDAFLDFDALGGIKSLQDAVRDFPPEATQLVLDVNDNDPDDSYSQVAYEKGFNLLMYLERMVGKVAFERFFQAYLAEFKYKTLTSTDFRKFFEQHFQGEKKIADIEWEIWFHGAGMPPHIVDFDRTMAAASEQLARQWHAFDADMTARKMAPTEDISKWTSNQTTCFLDTLLSLTSEHPLQLSTMKEFDRAHNFHESKNAEILCRYCQLAIAAEDESVLLVALHFITSQGRMKFTRPLYRALAVSKFGREAAVTCFLQHQSFYHPICAKLIANDLKQLGTLNALQPWYRQPGLVMCAAAGVAAAAAMGVALVRSRKR